MWGAVDVIGLSWSEVPEIVAQICSRYRSCFKHKSFLNSHLRRLDSFVSFNPYSPSVVDEPPTSVKEFPSSDRTLPFKAVLRTLPFSFAAGLLAAIVWGFGTRVVLLTAYQIYLLFGLLMGVAISSSLVFIGSCKQRSRAALFVRLSILVVGCTTGGMMIPLVSTLVRSLGWHVSSLSHPWMWAVLMHLPETVMVSIICLSLLPVKPLSLRRIIRLFGFGLIFTVLGMGAIDDLLRPNNFVVAHLTVRSIMLTLWFVSWIGTIVYEISSQCQTEITDFGSDSESRSGD